MPQLDFPPATPGAIYVAPNGVTYTFNASIGTGVWSATTTAALAVTPGSISGTAQVGQVLIYAPGMASGGTPPYTITQQWNVNGVAVSGQTGLNYTVQPTDAGKSITVTVTAKDSATPQATATATTAPTIVQPALTVTAGTIASGTPAVGTPVSYTPGVASGGSGGYTYTYLWKAGGGAAAGTGSTTTSYTPATGDIGKTLTVTITATDSSGSTANATTTATPAVVASAIPGTIWSPTPSSGPASTNTIATGVWNGTNDTVSSSGCIEHAVTTGAPTSTTTYGQGSTPVNTGQTLSIRWVSSSSCGDAADGTPISGTITNGTYTNSYSLTIDRVPVASSFAFGDLTGQTPSSVIASDVQTPSGYNATAYVTFTAPGSNALGSVEATINGGAWTLIPASGTSMTINPGETIQIRGTTGSTVSATYSTTINIGVSGNVSSDTWTVQNSSASPTVAQPSIQFPLNGSTNVGSGSGVTVVSSSYINSGGAGTQVSSDWETYKWIGTGSPTAPTTDPPAAANYTLVNSVTGSTTDLTTHVIPSSDLANSTIYYTRVRYTSNPTTVTSNWSVWSSFTTGPNVIPDFTKWFSDTTPPPNPPSGGGGYSGSFACGNYWNVCFVKGLISRSRGSDGWSTIYSDAGLSNGWIQSYGGCYFNNRWILSGYVQDGVLVPSGNYIWTSTSTDSGTWSRTSTTEALYQMIVVGNRAFCTSSGGICFSTNGTSWANVDTVAGGMSSIAYGNGTYVAVSPSETKYSTDGLTWNSTGNIGARAVAYGNGIFLATRSPSTPGSQFISVSTDGINWTTLSTTPAGWQNLGVDANWGANLVFANGAFFMYGSKVGGSDVYYTLDGTTLTDTGAYIGNSGAASVYAAPYVMFGVFGGGTGLLWSPVG